MSSIYRFPLKMHVGQPAVPVVAKGERVVRGQCIAQPQGLGARIHASVSGTVSEIANGFISIEADEVQSSEFLKIRECPTIAEMCREAGVVGAGGAGFPTHIKIGTELKGGTVIANCVECEPVLSHNVEMLESDPETMLKGLKYAMESVKAANGIVAIKAKHNKAIDNIDKLLHRYKDVSICLMDDIYPMGEERAIIHQISKEWLEPDQLPSSAGYVVLNAETLANIRAAVEDRKPVIDKDITVGGKLRNSSNINVFYQVPIGTPVSQMIDRCGGIDGACGEILLGGPYTGKAGGMQDVVTKTLGGIIATIPFPEYKGKVGLLVCACGANEERLRDIAAKMGAEVVEVLPCKNLKNIHGANKCMTPGKCPGQAEVVLKFRKAGAQRLIISNCSDCTNTVMNSAPKLNLGVYHHTDHVLRTMDMELKRRL